jgi:hypothetical protein
LSIGVLDLLIHDLRGGAEKVLCEHSIIYRFAILLRLDHGKEFRWPGQAAVMRREDKVCAQGASLSVPFSRGRSFFLW